ncbi:MAG: helix-turn-helix transcriptional regulator [Acidobacteriota bacterium]|nr:helix-turn-helix transcriptional regulator [Acidobacteriota bacterium]
MTPEDIDELVRLRRARDFVDREYASSIDVAAMARVASMSTAHFSRRFKAAYGETPYSYLMTRRVERAKSLLRQGASVTEACMAVGCTSLGSFSTRFTALVGEAPSLYRERDHGPLAVLPPCVSALVTRPRRARADCPHPAGLSRGLDIEQD